MQKVSAVAAVKPTSQRATTESSQQIEEQQQEAAHDLAFNQAGVWVHSDGRGFDLTGVPARLVLDTANEEQQAGVDVQEENKIGNDTGDQTVTASPEIQTIAEGSQELPATGVIADDTVTELVEGQMRKTEFLQKVRAAICQTIEPVLAEVGQTTEGCPYLNYWLDLYHEKDAGHIERTAKKYAPGSNKVNTAEEYVAVIAQRALRAAVIWSTTGKITGVPDGVPVVLPNEGSSPKNKTYGVNTVQAKAKNGGARRVDDPQLIQNELGEGQPLTTAVRSRMESAFGMNFSTVRTHTDATASRLSLKVNARAFTIGNHIAFGNGEYQPGTLTGDALMAHELAHTIQQRGAGKTENRMEVGAAGYDELENDADHTATGVLRSLWDRSTGLNGMLQNTVPLLRSGLKLQRCGGSTNTARPAVPRAPEVCPTSVELESTTNMTPGGLDLGYRTGYGIAVVMHLLPDTGDWSNAQVFERVSLATSSCPDRWNMCNPATRPFPINQSTHSTVLGELPARRNRFYDFHTSRWNNSRLHDSGQNPTGMDECAVVCDQSYVCGERVLGRFRITRNFRKALRNGREITEVNVTKTAVT